MMEVRTYLRKRDDGRWTRVVTDTGEPARVLEATVISEAEALSLASGPGTEHVAERRKD